MTVYNSHLLQYSDLELGQRVRRERQRQGLTLKQLAAATGGSIARLSEIENGLHVADLAQALAIASALHVPMHALLPRDPRIPFQITRESDIRSRPPRHRHGPDGAGNDFWDLADLFIGRYLNPMFGRIARQDEGTSAFWQHHAEEFVFVLRGSVTLTMPPSGAGNARRRRISNSPASRHASSASRGIALARSSRPPSAN